MKDKEHITFFSFFYQDCIIKNLVNSSFFYTYFE